MDVNKIYLGNNLDTLKTFPDNSINCCITSPPYFGLRDYGTATWQGGDPNCKHMKPISDTASTGTHKKMREMGIACASGIYKSVCPDCGAIRIDEQVGLEETPEDFINRLVEIFREIRRAMTDDGTLWLNIGDTYNSSNTGSVTSDKQKTNVGSVDNITSKHLVNTCKPKDMIGIPWMLAFALRNDGWYLRQDIIWHKPNPMPESVTDRCTKSHEYIFLLTKSPTYYFDHESMQEDANPLYASRYNSPFNVGQKELLGGGRPDGASNTPGMKEYTGKRNKRDVWTIQPSKFKGAHFATFPEELVRQCLLAGCPKGGVVLDPFMGSGTVGVVAKKNHRNYVGCELNPEYIAIAENRIKHTQKKLF